MSRSATTLFCFSPPVMLATFLVEIIFALYIIWRYKMTTITRLVVAMLVCLATFQGAEYMLCGGLGLTGGAWSQLGYSAITLLPPLGIHLGLTIAKKKSLILVGVAYLSAIIFVGYFAFMTNAISGHTCYANYAVFDTHQGAISSLFYSAYYYVWLMVGVGLALHHGRLAKDQHIRRALYALAAGYLAFIVPTATIATLDQSAVAGIPSIMCGFAVIFAFILVGKVAPESIALKKTQHSLRFRLPF